jgi:glucose/arabinose dehydrogenase
MIFGADRMLYIAIADGSDPVTEAQDLRSPNGKIHRIRDDGSIPDDNPFVGVPNAIPSIWSYGNRSPQGLAVEPATGELWSTEHARRR